MNIKDILSIILPILGLIGTFLTIYADRKKIKEDPTAAFSDFASRLSSNIDPTPGIRQRKLYGPHNRRMSIIFGIGIFLIIIPVIIGIVLVIWKDKF